MTLARGNIGGDEFDRMVLPFSMMDGAQEQHRFSELVSGVRDRS
ncbi:MULTISPECIES: hypothetical protein [unclassified Bradyrhizobium]